MPAVGDDDTAAGAFHLDRRVVQHHFGSGSVASGGGKECIQAGGQAFAARLEFGVRGAGFAGEDIEQAAHMIAALEKQGGQFRGDGKVAVTQGVEQVLDAMRECFDEMAFDDARATLDGVSGAENAVDVVLVVRILLQLEQARFHLGQLLAAFLDEDAGNFVHVYLVLFQGVSCAGMTSGSPNSTAMLQNSTSSLTA